MTAPTLLPYQDRWVRDASPLKIVEKSRRIGLSWAEAYDSVLYAGEGRGSVYYQSYAKDMTRGFIDDCAWWAEKLSIAAGTVGEEIVEDVQTFKLRMHSGREIVAMTSAPRAFRSKGRPGDRAVIDEAAFVDDLDEVLKAALAFLTWGGHVHVISTHNGEASPYNILLRDVRDGRQPGSSHTITFRQAIEEGLARRIFEVSDRPWSAEAEAQWEAEIRQFYGHRGAEELDCIPSAGSGAWLTWEIIRAAEHKKAGDPEGWENGLTYIGVDVARRRDLWVAAVLESAADVLWLRQMEVRQGIPFSEQRQIVRELADRYRPIRIAVDQTGMGEAVVEQLQEDHGTLRVEGVLMSAPRRLDVATAIREVFEDRRIRIPAGEALRRDLHSIRAEAGPTGQPRLLAETGETDGHADRFWAIALACAAASGGAGPIEGLTTPPRVSFGAFGDEFGRDGGFEVDRELGVVHGRCAGLRGFV